MVWSAWIGDRRRSCRAAAATYDWRRVALDGPRGRGHGAEEGAVALALQHVDGLVGQGRARLLERLVAGLEVVELEPEPQGRGQRLEDAPARGDHLQADAIAGDEAWAGGSRVSQFVSQ